MSKLYFRYGTMGSSKTAQALMVRFNYLESGKNVWLIKPGKDNRDGINIIRSRIGLEANADVIKETDNIFALYQNIKSDVIIADECQFFTTNQINQLRNIVDEYDIPVMCFGLRTDFQTKLFDGAKRLMEIADSIAEIKMICKCGNKAIVNARKNKEGKIITEGERILIGGNESYEATCHRCWINAIREDINQA